MRASILLRSARRQAGISQRKLAAQAGVPQSSVARIEREVVSPSVDTLDRLLKECGFEVEVARWDTEGVDRTLIAERLKLSPLDRILAAENEWRGAVALRDAARRAR
jgi:transcriptional regulator with XRE-family HTH domain